MKVHEIIRLLCSTELSEDIIKLAKDVKPVTEIKQTGNDFVITSKTPGRTVTNSFTIGKEAEITTMDGKKLKVLVFIYLPFFEKLTALICKSYEISSGRHCCPDIYADLYADYDVS